ASFAEYHRLARLNVHPGKEELCSQPGEFLFYQIKLSHGDPTGKQQQVCRQSFFHELPQSSRFVRSNRELHRLSSGKDHLCSQRIAVAVAYLVLARSAGGVNNFVSGRKNRHLRVLIDFEDRLSHGSRDGNLGKAQACSSWQHLLSGPGFTSGRDNVLARSARTLDLYLVTVEPGVFHHHHRIRT